MLSDPTEHLRMLCDHLDDSDASRRWHQLHMHIAAGGDLPAQWLSDNSAAGHVAVLVRSEAVLLIAADDANDKARGAALMRALHGLGMEVE